MSQRPFDLRRPDYFAHGHEQRLKAVRADRVTTLKNWAPRRASRYKGAQATGIKGQWRAVIHDPRISGGRACLGRYDDERLASLAYDSALWLLGEEPLSIKPQYFEAGHSPELQKFIAKIAEKIGKPYPPSAPAF